jgi:hypothetical protein
MPPTSILSRSGLGSSQARTPTATITAANCYLSGPLARRGENWFVHHGNESSEKYFLKELIGFSTAMAMILGFLLFLGLLCALYFCVSRGVPALRKRAREARNRSRSRARPARVGARAEDIVMLQYPDAVHKSTPGSRGTRAVGETRQAL